MCTKQSDTQKVNIHPFGCLWWWIISSDFKPKFNAKHGKALFFIYLLYQLRKDTAFIPASWEAMVLYWSCLTCSKRMNQVAQNLEVWEKWKKSWWYRYIKFFSRNRDFKYHLIHLKNIFNTSIKISFNDET